MRELYKIHEIGDYGRSIATHGTVFANSPKEAEKLAAEYHGNPEIYTTGFYKARVEKQVASITPEKIEEHRQQRLQQAKWDLERFSKPLKL